MKPRAAADWHTIDKAIDRAQKVLRADALGTKRCKQSLAELPDLIDSGGATKA